MMARQGTQQVIGDTAIHGRCANEVRAWQKLRDEGRPSLPGNAPDLGTGRVAIELIAQRVITNLRFHPAILNDAPGRTRLQPETNLHFRDGRR